MNRKFMILGMVLIVLLMAGQAYSMTVRAEASRNDTTLTDILVSIPFNIDVYMNNDDSVASNPLDGKRLTFSMPFAFHDNGTSIGAVTLVDSGGTTEVNALEKNGIDGYFDLNWFVTSWSWDGTMPDSINFTGIGFNAGWPYDLGEQLYLRFTFQVENPGEFCIDSIGGRTAVYDWLLDPPSPHFNGGTYCWDITDGTVDVLPVQLSVDNIVANACSFECVPVLATDFENVAGVELHLTYDDACMDFDSIDVGALTGATVNGGNGEIHIIWDNYASPLTVADGSTLVQLCFTNIVGEACPIGFVGTTELVDDTGTPLEIILTDGSLGYTCTSTPSIACPQSAVDTAFCDGVGEVYVGLTISDYESVTTSMGSWAGGTLTFSSVGPDQYNIMVYASSCCGAVADSCQVTVNVSASPLPQVTCPSGVLDIFQCSLEQYCISVPVTDHDSVVVGGWSEGGEWINDQFCFTPSISDYYNFVIYAFNECGFDSCHINAQVTINTLPMVMAQADTSITLCEPEEVCMTYSVSDVDETQILTEMLETAPNGALIDTANNTICYTPAQADSYEFIVRATDECGVSSVDTVMLTVAFDTAPMMTCPEAIDISICDASQICVSVPITGADSVWTTQGVWVDGELCFTANSTETYYFDVYAENECGLDSCNFAVNVTMGGSPTVTCPPELTQLFLCQPDTVCIDMPINGATSVEAMTGNWLDGTFCFTADTAGLYSLIVIARNDCDSFVCEFSYNITRGLDPEITCPQVEMYDALCGPEMVCFDLPIANADSVSVSEGSWQNGLYCFMPDTAGTYFLYVEAYSECGFDSCAIMYTISFIPEPEVFCPQEPINAALPGPQLFCVFVDIFNADSAYVDGDMGNPYLLDSAFCFDVTVEGTYYFDIWAFNDCSYDSCIIEVNVTFTTPIEACFAPTSVAGPIPLEVCFSNCSVCDDTCFYEWQVDGITVSNEFEPCLIFTEPGCYDIALIVTDGFDYDTAYVADAICGEDVYPPMWISVYCASPMLNDMPLLEGDIIEAFDPEGTLCGTDTVEFDGSYGLLDIVHDDITTMDDEGAMEGDTIGFKINGVEVATIPAIIWTQDGDYFELCTFTSAECLTINLVPGWNWISWNLSYTDDIGNFVADFSECIYVVHGFDQRGLTYVPALADFSTLNSVDYYHGYMFKMDCSALIEICAPEISSGESIVINYGWNLVSYWPDAELDVETALASIINDVLVVLGFSNGGGLVWAPGFVDYNTLTHMNRLFGYWIKSSASTGLYYPGFSGPVAPVKSGFAAEKVAPSRSWMSLYGAGLRLDGQNLAGGTAIDVYTQDMVLCGSSTISGGLLKFMPVYGYDNAENITMAYPQQDEELILYVNGIRAYPDIIWNGHGAQYRLGDLSTSANGSNLMPEGFALYQNYPNPFNPTTSIRFHLSKAGNVELAVFNSLGQKIRTIINESLGTGEHIRTWDGKDEEGDVVASGIYLYRLKSGSLVQTKKMNLMK